MRQLGRHQFECDPGRYDPGEQNFATGFGARTPHCRCRQSGQHGARKERFPKRRVIKARRQAMGFLPARHLGQHVLTEGVDKKATVAANQDGNKPRHHQCERPRHADYRFQPPQPVCGTIRRHKRDRGEPHEHQDHRSLDQNSRRDRTPEDRGNDQRGHVGGTIALLHQIGPRHRAQCRHRGQQ